MIRCLLIEDDKKTVELIKNIANELPEISFNNVKEDHEGALNFILKYLPDIVFMNIQFNKINLGEFFFETSLYSQTRPSFVALSSLKENAFEAYKYDFSDFILKPLNELSLRKCVLKHQKKNPIKEIETLCLKSYKDYQYLNIEDILYLKADNNTTDFYMADGSVISAYKTLKVFENLLPQIFIRIHKSYIINKNCISRIHYGKSICIINNEHKIPFTKTFKTNMEILNNDLSNSTIITLN